MLVTAVAIALALLPVALAFGAMSPWAERLAGAVGTLVALAGGLKSVAMGWAAIDVSRADDTAGR